MPETFQDDLLLELHWFDKRLYFLLCTHSSPRELIVTADGDQNAFSSADALVNAAPPMDDWLFVSLKPAMGFEFERTDGPISIDVSRLWFLPLRSSDNPSLVGLALGVPNADFVLSNQSIDKASTILETGLGERACAKATSYVSVDTLPDVSEHRDWLQRQLPDDIAYDNRRQNG